MPGTGVGRACGGDFRVLLLVHIVAHVGERRRGTQVRPFLVLAKDRQLQDLEIFFRSETGSSEQQGRQQAWLRTVRATRSSEAGFFDLHLSLFIVCE